MFAQYIKKTIAFAIILLSLFLLFVPPQTFAQNKILNSVDTCGTRSGFARRVPDRFFSYDFQNACQSHDDCYSNLINKKTCDWNLRSDMLNTCNTAPYKYNSVTGYDIRNRLVKRGCQGIARVYYQGVDKFGKRYYGN
jgi:Prokaryotic phospholipase A2